MTTLLPSPPRRWPWLRLAGLVILALVVAAAWKQIMLEQAASELRAAGFDYQSREVWALRWQEWRNAFMRELWAVNRFAYWDRAKAPPLRNLDGVAPALRRLAIERLYIDNCDALENVDALKDVVTLKDLDIINCQALGNVNGIKGLKGLKSLNLEDCTSLKNTGAFQGHAMLEFLNLRDCWALNSLDGLDALTGLKELNLLNCPRISDESIAALKRALPNTHIFARWPEPKDRPVPEPLPQGN